METKNRQACSGRAIECITAWTRVTLFTVSLTGLAGCAERDNNDITTASGNSAPLGGSTMQSSLSGSRTSPDSCEIADMNSWVYDNMRDYYLFNNQVRTDLSVSDYATSESLVKDLRVLPQDTFSYMTDETTYNAFFEEGEAFGFGWNISRAPDDNIYFSLIDPGSPMDQAGVKRGDQLLAINSVSIEDFFVLSVEEKTAMLGASGDSTTIEIETRNLLGVTQRFNVTSDTYGVQTVLDTRVIERNGLRIGYLHFHSFISTSRAELDEAFALLSAQNIDELVLDLRFNGGGRISIANELSSYVLGHDNTDKVFTTFAYNNDYQANNVSLYFRDMNNSLDLYRLFVLQSSRTCSASELIVNSLRPFIPVITVGSTSCGKPYGTSPNTACSKVLNVLEIELLNANNSGGYFDGITADCPVSEDVGIQLGQQSEPLFAAALGYIDSGSCDIATARSAAKRISEAPMLKPAWQGGNNF